jgi:hypothetical protein
MADFVLDSVHFYAEWVRTDADTVRRFVGLLPSRPSYETKAADAMKQAELALVEALKTIKDAQEEYAKLRESDR